MGGDELVAEFFHRERARLQALLLKGKEMSKSKEPFSAPITPEQIEEIAYLVKVGLILGFVVRGEIDLGERVINK